MSKEQKELGTSHYHSGIYDVVNVPPKKEERRQNVVVRQDTSELHNILVKLSANVEENTRMLHSVSKALGKRAQKKRKDRVQIDVRMSFLRIVDIDTKGQTFSADVFIQAAWQDPALKGMSQRDLDDLDFDTIWTPSMKVLNMDDSPDDVKRYYVGYSDQPGYKYPLMLEKTIIRSKFKESLELFSFPADIQALNITVASEHPATEVFLVEDGASINVQNFQDESEFHLQEHVEVEAISPGTRQGKNLQDNRPQMNFRCHVSRRCGYYFWNLYLVLFLVTSLMFSCYSMQASDAANRLKISVSLLLIIVAFLIAVAKDLPAVPYVTYLGVYILACLFFLVWQTIQNAFIGAVEGIYPPSSPSVDGWFAIALMIVFVLFNIIYFAFIGIKYYLKNRDLQDKNARYKQNMAPMRQYDTRSYDNRSYENRSYDNHGYEDPRTHGIKSYVHQKYEQQQDEVHGSKRKHKKRTASVDIDPEPVYISRNKGDFEPSDEA